MSNHYLFLDTETTSLDPERGTVWEIGYAIDDEPVISSVVTHSLVGANEVSLDIGNYWTRMAEEPFSAFEGAVWEQATRDRLAEFDGTLYLVGANPSFDQAFLQARWGRTYWHHRMIDVETFAMGAISPLTTDGPIVPQGLYSTCEFLRTLGWDIPTPDHSAKGDVEATRAAFKALVAIHTGETP